MQISSLSLFFSFRIGKCIEILNHNKESRDSKSLHVPTGMQYHFFKIIYIFCKKTAFHFIKIYNNDLKYTITITVIPVILKSVFYI